MDRHAAKRLTDLNLFERTVAVGLVANTLQTTHGKNITYAEIAEKAGVAKQVAKDAVKVIVEAYGEAMEIKETEGRYVWQD